MSGHHSASTQATGPVTPDAFLADRQGMWSGFTHATVIGVIFVVLLLIAMAVFLL